MNLTDLTLDAVGLPLNPVNACDMARIDLAAQFAMYGQHPHCRRCRFPCKQYNAPDSEIVYCPKHNGDADARR